MSFNTKILAAAIVAGLSATSANAAVTISATTPVPVRIATEANFTSGDLLVANATNNLDLISASGYAFSNGEVRYVRFECSAGMEFTTATATSSAAGAIGAVNGIGTNAISFSFTAGAGTTTADTFTVAGTRTFTSRDAVNCTYGLYDQPSQAAAGGTTGRIATASGAYANFMSSYLYDNTVATRTASVEANPSFSAFLNTAASPSGTGTTTTAQIGQIVFDTRGNIGPGTQPIDTDGEAITLANILAPTTSHVITGDFSAAANATAPTYTGAALNRVFVSAVADCSAVTVPASSLTATSATFVTGAAAVDGYLCYTPRTGQAIQASQYAISLVPVSNTGYTAGPLGPEFVGTIVRDGTEIQAPLAQVPAGYQSRIALTNRGSVPRSYTVEILLESGNTRNGDPAQLTGTIPANSLHVVELATLMGTFTAAPRGTVNVTVAGPSTQIQGLYQIVNPANGSISNHVMVRPGTN